MVDNGGELHPYEFKIFVVLSALIHGTTFLPPAAKQDALFWFLIVVIIATAAVADVAALYGTLAVEKDWVVVVCGGDSQVQ